MQQVSFIYKGKNSKKIFFYICNNDITLLTIKDSYLQTPLHLSLFYNHCEITDTILNFYSFLSQDIDGNNEFHKWINSSCLFCLNNLKSKLGERINLLTNINNRNNNALHQCIINNKVDSFQLLLNCNIKFDLMQNGENDNNLMHLACLYGNNVYHIFKKENF
jgi:hypothetical protein